MPLKAPKTSLEIHKSNYFTNCTQKNSKFSDYKYGKNIL